MIKYGLKPQIGIAIENRESKHFSIFVNIHPKKRYITITNTISKMFYLLEKVLLQRGPIIRP